MSFKFCLVIMIGLYSFLGMGKEEMSDSSSLKDLYVFFINGDGLYNYKACPEGSLLCPQDFVVRDASEDFFRKTENLAKNCNHCDVVIIYVNPERRTGIHGYTMQTYNYTIYEKIYFYRNGHLKDIKKILSLSDTAFIPLPFIGKITAFMQKKELKQEIKLFKKYFFEDGLYRYQLAFFFGHKIPDSPQRGYFPSSYMVKFSLDNFLNGLNQLSYEINGQHRPFDALFLAQCLSTIDTIYKIAEKKSASLVLASPELISLKGLVEWNLEAIYERVRHQPSDMKKSLSDWLKQSFTSNTKENVTDKVFSRYSLSLFDMDSLSNLQEDFDKAVNLLKKDKSYSEEQRKKWKAIASGGENKNFNISGLPNFDCGKIKVLKDFLEKSSQGVINYSHESSILSIILEEEVKVSHSGWSCL